MVRWFESQGDSANASAGIVGNLEQESQLNPAQAGGGLAQWTPAWYGQMVAYAASVGLSPTSDQGQLAYLQYDLRTSYSSLLARMDTAPDPGTAAEMFETTYEQCQGVVGYMDVIPGSLCEDAQPQAVRGHRARAGRRLRDHHRAGVVGGAGRRLRAGGGVRIGQGPDPLTAVGAGARRHGRRRVRSGRRADLRTGRRRRWSRSCRGSKVRCGMQPFMLFHFTQEQAGTEDGDQYWYVAEQITPVTETIGTTFAQGQPVAHFAACGTGIEIGWGSPTSGQGTLAGQMGDGAAANPAAGSLTPWAESFKRWCQMPASWIGTSP